MDNLVNKAIEFATQCHKGQFRKYGGLEYITHPIAVSELVAQVTDNPEVIAAAVLHDTVEDTDATLEQIKEIFGEYVSILVGGVTNVAVRSDGNRKTRCKLNREHVKKSLPDAKTIKIADVIHNLSDLVENDPDFYKTYKKEKYLLLDESLREGNEKLFKTAWEMVN